MVDSNSPETPYKYSAEHPPSIAVVNALAALKGIEPTELDYTLYHYIQPETLDTLLRSGTVEVTFTVEQYEVTVSGTSTVQITHRYG